MVIVFQDIVSVNSIETSYYTLTIISQTARFFVVEENELGVRGSIIITCKWFIGIFCVVLSMSCSMNSPFVYDSY